jgi:hypothetical protein
MSPIVQCTAQIERNTGMIQRLTSDLNNKEQAITIEQAAVDLTVITKGPLPAPSSRNREGGGGRNKVITLLATLSMREGGGVRKKEVIVSDSVAEVVMSSM